MVFYRTSDKFIIRDNVIGQMILQGEINSIKFSENQIKNYIENQATKCPFCGSENIVPDCTEVEGIRYISEMGCNNCEKTWTEHFEHILKLMSVPEDEIEVALMDGNYYNNGYEINLTHSYIEN